MPSYFFDIHDGDYFTSDDTGVELVSIAAVKYETKKALRDTVKDEVRDSDGRDFVVVQDKVGHNLWRVTLSLAVESSLRPWLAVTERARSLDNGPVVTRRSHVTDGVPDDPVKRLKL
jgi:hypothetical protein